MFGDLFRLEMIGTFERAEIYRIDPPIRRKQKISISTISIFSTQRLFSFTSNDFIFVRSEIENRNNDASFFQSDQPEEDRHVEAR